MIQNLFSTTFKSYFTFRQRQLLSGLVLLAFILRLYQLAEQGIWFDESLSALFAVQPLDIAIQSMLQEGLHHSPLFYILLRPFAAGDFSEFGVRFLPVVLGVLTIPLMAQLGRLMANNQIGLLAATLLVISPFHVWYSQEARMYTLLILSSVGAMFFFVRNFNTPHYTNWLIMALFIAVGVNSHHFAFFIPLIQFIFIVVTLKQNYSLLRPWVGAQLLVALSLIPWVMIVLNRGEFYLSSASRKMPTIYDLIQTVWNFSIGYTERVTFFVIVALIIFLALLVLGIKSAIRTSNKGLLLVLWFVIPLVVTFLVSFRLPTYMDRYISLSLPPFLLSVAIGITSIRRQLLGFVIFILVLGAMLVGLYQVYQDTTVYARADWRSVGAYLAENVATTDIIAPWYYQDLIPLSFYYHGPAPTKPVIIFNKADLPSLSPGETNSQRLWVVIAHPNHSAHLVGHCQDFNIEEVSSLVTAVNWRDEYQNRLSFIKEFTCIRVEVYE